MNKIAHETSAASLLMSRPTYFTVSYSINPWMHPTNWQKNSEQLLKQAQIGWEAMYQMFLSLGASIELVPPQNGLPDMVFTANAAIVLDRKVLLSRFYHPQRQGEQKHFAEFFEQIKNAGIVDEVKALPENIYQEGAGDCTWDTYRKIFWAGYGPRSSKEAIPYIKDYFGKPIVALELDGDEFYHIDVSLCPLSNGHILCYQQAFTKESCAVIFDKVPEEKLILIDREDAVNFSVNAVNLENKIVMANCSDKLKSKLEDNGYLVIKVPVETFALSGGSVFCMTLRLDSHS